MPTNLLNVNMHIAISIFKYMYMYSYDIGVTKDNRLILRETLSSLCMNNHSSNSIRDNTMSPSCCVHASISYRCNMTLGTEPELSHRTWKTAFGQDNNLHSCEHGHVAGYCMGAGFQANA